MISEEEAVARAKSLAQSEGWAWVDPAIATWRPGWSSGTGRWEVFSNAQALGAKVRVVIDGRSGAILEKGYIPR
jgi:hypothetical protein